MWGRGSRTVGVISIVAMLAVGLTATAVGAATPAPIVAATATAASSAYERTLAQHATQRLDWTECYPGEGTPEFQCADMRAPRDWARPQRGDITVAISRVAASGPNRRGILLTNPGGPGDDGVWLPLYFEQAEPELAAVYDIIGMAPRGLGTGASGLNCADPSVLDRLYALDGRDHSPAIVAQTLALSKQYGQTCARDPLAPSITTDQTVRDLDLIRAIFRAPKISYLGFSAGSSLGAYYATLFPSRVDRFVFDGSFNWTKDWYTGHLPQPQAFQRSFEQDFAGWMARYDSDYGLGTTARAVVRTTELRRVALVKHPITLTDGSILGAPQYDNAIGSALYFDVDYPGYALSLSIVEYWDQATPDEQAYATYWLASGSAGVGDNVFWAITCGDTASPPLAQVARDWQVLGARYPLTGASWLALPCPFWGNPPAGWPVTGRGLPKVLMLNNDGDPATPYVGAQATHAATKGSVLVTVKHQPDHTIYGLGDACVENIANAWLLRGVLPSRDQTCEGLPLPTPYPRAAAAARAAAPAAAPVPFPVWARQFAADHGLPASPVAPR